MSFRFALFMFHAAMLQIIVLALRLATSYQALEVDLGAFELGLISASFAVLPLFLALPLGRMIDKRGPDVAILIGAASLVIAVCSFNFFGGSVWGLLISTMLLGCAHFMSMVGQHSYVALFVEPKTQDTRFGWYAAAISFGQIIGPGVIASSSDGVRPDLSSVYLICVPLSIIHLATFTCLSRSSYVDGGVLRVRTSVSQLFQIKGVRVAILAGVAVMAGMDLLTIYLPLVGSERGIDASMVAALIAVRAVFTLLSRVSYGYLAKRFRRNILLSVSIFSAGIACAILVVSLPLPLMFVAIAAFGFGLGAALPITLTWITEIAPLSDRGTVFSLRQSVLRASQIAIPVAGGALAALYGASSIFLVLAVFLCGTAVATQRS